MGFEEGYNNARLMQFDFVKSFEEGRQRRRDENLRNLAADYFGGKVNDSNMQAFLGEVARNGGDPRSFQQDLDNKRDHFRQEVGRSASFVLSAQTPEARAQAYAHVRGKLAPLTSEFGIEFPEAWSEDMLPEVQNVANILGSQQQGGMRPMNVSPGGVIVDPNTGREIYSNQNFAPMKPQWDSNRGGWAMPPSQSPRPNGLSALMGGPQAGLGGLGGLAAMAPGSVTTPGFPDLSSPQSSQGGGFMQVAPPRPNYEAERLRLSQEANARANQAAQDAAEARRRAGFGNAPPGQRFDSVGNLEDIPGYRPPAAPVKPIPPAGMRLITDERDLVQTSENINSNIDKWVGWLDSGKLPLGMLSNPMNAAKNYAGFSDEGSRNYQSFRAGLEKMRNDSLRLNKGVQTEGDAVRAWNELLANINDEGVVKQRLAEIRQLNERARLLHQSNVEMAYQNYGRDPSGQGSGPAPRPAAASQKAKEGDIVENDKGVRLQLQKGQWVRIK
jgi:hypothetical protein